MKRPVSKLARYALLFGAAAFVFGLDQISKALVLAYMAPGEAIPVCPGFFDLVCVANRGAAFGFLNRSDIEWQFWLFLVATCIAFWAILTLAKNSLKQPLLLIGLGMIMGGAGGNLLDRIRFRAVTDFLDFYWGSWHWPAFNVADMGICVGVALAIFSTWVNSPKRERK